MKIFTHLLKHGLSATVKRVTQEFEAFRHFKHRLIPFSTQDNSGIGEEFIYCSHPFTNWSLNPGYKNNAGEKIHTIEGFRKTSDYESVERYFETHKDKPKIYCLGGSTTYCVEVIALEKPWPSKLSDKIKRHDTGMDCIVTNAGVGGWNTLQSIIRLISWGPILNPALIIVYQSKNDLAPLYNADLTEPRAYPDYSNLMGQFSRAISDQGILSSRVCRQANGGVGCVYGKLSEAPQKGLQRFDDRMLLSTTFHYEMICAVAERLGARVLFVPEIIRGGPYYPYMQTIHREMKEIALRHKCCFFLDIQPMIPNDSRYFLDQMHFSEAGCELFSDIVARHVTLKGLLK